MYLISTIQTRLYTESQLLFNHGNHCIFKVAWETIRDFYSKWEDSREIDILKVNEMYNNYTNHIYIPIYISFAEYNNKLVCYDGNHRCKMIDLINQDNFILIIDVMFNATQKEIASAFSNINKDILLFKSIQNQQCVENQMLNLIDWYAKLYPSFVSSTYNCRRPNFNKHRFLDNLHSIYKYFTKTKSIDQIKQALLKLNIEYANARLGKTHELYPITVISKCKMYNFWLFIDGNINPIHVIRVIN